MMKSLGDWKEKGLKLFKEYCPKREFALHVIQGKSDETDKGVCYEIHELDGVCAHSPCRPAFWKSESKYAVQTKQTCFAVKC